jgi:hypothetical protein
MRRSTPIPPPDEKEIAESLGPQILPRSEPILPPDVTEIVARVRPHIVPRSEPILPPEDKDLQRLRSQLGRGDS